MKKIKRETENKEEHSPHTPYKEKQEGEREAAAATSNTSRILANVDGAGLIGFFPKSANERKTFISTPPSRDVFLEWCRLTGLADSSWLVTRWSECISSGWLDDDDEPIKNWPKYFLRIMRNSSQSRISNKGLITRKGAYKRLSGDDKTMFDAFWDAYPTRRRTEKDKCADLLMRILAENGTDKVAMFNRLMDGLDKWKQSYDWTKQSGEFVMMPYRWLFNECWDTPPQGGSPTERRHGVSQTANVKLSEDQIGW